MENEQVIGGLTRKGAEIAGQIGHTQASLRKLATELGAIDAAIRIFDHDADIATVKRRHLRCVTPPSEAR